LGVSCAVRAGAAGLAQAPRIPRGFRVRRGPHFERAGANAESSRATANHGEPTAADAVSR
jgi:hypothetical protein